MLTVTFCIIISLLQLILINIIVKPRSFYLCIFHFFLIYPVIFNQLVPLFLKLITPSVGMEISIELVQAYVINFIYFVVCLTLWRIFTSVYREDRPSSQLLFPSGVVAFISILSIIYNLLVYFQKDFELRKADPYRYFHLIVLSFLVFYAEDSKHNRNLNYYIYISLINDETLINQIFQLLGQSIRIFYEMIIYGFLNFKYVSSSYLKSVKSSC